MPTRENHGSQSLSSTDVDEMALLQSDWQLQYEQLSPGRFAGSLHHLALPHAHLVAESLNKAVRQRGQTNPNGVGFGLALAHKGPSYFHGQRQDGCTLMIGRGDELDLTSPDNFELIGLLVNETLLKEIWAQLYQDDWSTSFTDKIAVKAEPSAAHQVRATHLNLLRTVAANPLVLQDPQAATALRDTILLEWLRAIPDGIDTSDLPTTATKRRLVTLACEFVLSQQAHPPTMLRVCRTVGASPRKLDYCFRDVLGMSPSRYLRIARLNGVRRDLKRSRDHAVTILDVASHWGFWHMGAFSKAYQLQFGELPSQTRCAG